MTLIDFNMIGFDLTPLPKTSRIVKIIGLLTFLDFFLLTFGKLIRV